MPKRKTFAQVRKEASDKARIDTIAECCRVLKHYVGDESAADRLFEVMSAKDFKREKQRETSSARFINMTPDDYFGINNG